MKGFVQRQGLLERKSFFLDGLFIKPSELPFVLNHLCFLELAGAPGGCCFPVIVIGLSKKVVI